MQRQCSFDTQRLLCIYLQCTYYTHTRARAFLIQCDIDTRLPMFIIVICITLSTPTRTHTYRTFIP